MLKASEIVTRLNELISEHGDRYVFFDDPSAEFSPKPVGEIEAATHYTYTGKADKPKIEVFMITED